MEVVDALPVSALYAACDPDQLAFETTDELKDVELALGQERATEALQFGIGMKGHGYHVFALGPRETDKERVVRSLLEEKAGEDASLSDWCYVFNFEQPHQPHVLRLPAGTGRQLQADMERFVEELQTALTAAFESEEYQTRRQGVEVGFQRQHEQELTGLQEEARERDVALMRTPAGFLFVPIRDGEPLPPNEIQNLPEEVRRKLEADVEELQEKLLHILRKIPSRQRDLGEQVRSLNQEIARYVVGDLIDGLRAQYAELPQVLSYLDEVAGDVVENVRHLVRPGDSVPEAFTQQLMRSEQQRQGREMIRRYQVNAFATRASDPHTPVIHEDHPTLQNLVGRVEYQSQMGTLTTDFSLIKPGALHQANGGFLMLDARKVLLQPFAWEALKRTLRAGEIRIQGPQDELGLVSTTSLDPEPVPLDVKVVLFGDRLLYYLLYENDPEFADLFKVEADFDEQMERTDESEQLYARLVARMAREAELRPFDRRAVARIVEYSARRADDAERLSTESRAVRDLLREADHWAGQNAHDVVEHEDVVQALEMRRYRSGRLRERVQESILRDIQYIDTEGAVVGQINGLSVLQLGRDRFGRPSRITARVHMGRGDVVDIEREVELGGPLHSKGVLILASFLAARYASDTPLSLSASLVFEQSYGGVDGDSASSAELYALLSAIADVPLKQSLAVTGSVNQHGRVQPIGGVNEKIEGFFTVCRERGLTGEQGVLVPASNVKNLMLREEVRSAAADGAFHIYPIETIDRGMELLTGRPMGELDDGAFPEGTINRRVVERLTELAEERTAFLSNNNREKGV